VIGGIEQAAISGAGNARDVEAGVMA